MSKKYDASTIEQYDDLEYIRHKVKGYVTDRGTAGLVHAIREVIDNSVDETVLRPDGGTIFIGLFRDLNKGRFQILVKDEGRGIPLEKLRLTMTKLHVSGKMSEKTSYVSSGGSYGVGAKVVVALSFRYRCISKNYLDLSAGSVILNDGVLVGEQQEAYTGPSGVTTVFELDAEQFFPEAQDFMMAGYLELTALCKQLNIFNDKINFQFYIYDRKLPEHFWSDSIPEALGTVDGFLLKKDKHVEYSSLDVPDKTQYLFELWKINSGIVFQDSIDKAPANAEDKLGFSIKFYFTRKSAIGLPQYFVAVNNVSLLDKTMNTATIVFMNLLRYKIGELQETAEYRQFVTEDYKFPTLLLAIDVRYHRAELAGITKTSFKDETFGKQFAAELAALLGARGNAYWQPIADLLKSDIQAKYASYYDTPIKKSDDRKVYTELNFFNNYKECKSADREKCELFIVEGTSAGAIVSTRDTDYQAVYATRGKPLNAASSMDKMAENRKALLKDPIYQDLMKITRITPNTTDMSSSRFGKIIIAADADPDGYHIVALHIHNLYILNPRIIESGMVWVANPPLYSLDIGKHQRLFLRDKPALMDARIEFIYKPTLDIQISTPAGITKLDDALFRETCYVVNYLGEQFESVAKQLNIPLLILERLVLAIQYIYPTVDYLNLAKCFESNDPLGYTRIQLHEASKYIVISVDKEDYPIGLDSIGNTIRTHLLPLVKRFHYAELEFLVKSNYKGSVFSQYTKMSAMMLYSCLRSLDNMPGFSLYRYKGLGQLVPSDTLATLMDPKTRSITQITSVGDPVTSYDLIGNDSTARKQLLKGSVALSASFLRENLNY